MTNLDALALLPGDRIRPRWKPGGPTHQEAMTVLRVRTIVYEQTVVITTTNGQRFEPWEIEGIGPGDG